MPNRRTLSFGRNFARTQFSSLVSTAKRRRQASNLLKSLTFPELCEAIDHLDRNTNPLIKQSLFGNPLPASIAEIGNSNHSNVGETIIDEINWNLVSIRQYIPNVNLFLIYKDSFERLLLTGEYDEAERFLEKIETEICCSMWGLENRFLLSELRNSGLANKELLLEFNETSQGTAVIKSLAHWLSIRAEQNLSVKRFTTDLDTALSKIDKEAYDKNRDYYLFKLSFLNNTDFKHFTDILNWDFQQSILDRYLTLRKVLTNLLTSATTEKDDLEQAKLVKDYVLNRISYLIKKVDDPILYKLKLFGENKLFPAFEMSDSVRQIEIQDHFTLGSYAEAEEGARELLQLRPCQFDLYQIYIESLIFQKKKFQPIGSNSSLQNQILIEIYRMISATQDPNESGFALLKIANNIASSVLSYGIIDFVLVQTKGELKRKMLAGLSYNLANPSSYECFRTPNEQKMYLEFLSNKFPNSITLRFLTKKTDNIDSISEFKEILPKARYLTEQAKACQQKGELTSAIKVWKEILQEFKDMMPLRELAVRNLYTCLLAKSDFDDCIDLFVDNYCDNPFIVDKIDSRPLVEIIKKNRFKNVRPSINLPIFYSLVHADENEIHIAAEKYNISKGVLIPSELCNNEKEFNLAKLKLYLRVTCTTEVLKHSIHINGSKARLEERLTICEFLKSNDPDHISVYNDEIKSITNILIIQQGRIELDESKIYVNENGIIQSELRDFEAIHSRFNTIAKLSAKKLRVILLEGGKLTALDVERDEASDKQLKYSTNPSYDIYLELFEAIKEKFLYSKFGIVAYLSTRIRHGVLLGEIRPIFEKHKLITQKDGDSSEYRVNEYWNKNLAYELPLAKSRVQELLREFSTYVDGLIYDLIKKHLQVADHKSNPEGWFDYNFSEEDLFWSSVQSALKTTDFGTFVNSIFDILWIRTDENLKVIREKIQTTIADEFNGLFTSLESDVSNVLTKQNAQSLSTAINACSTEVQATMTRISNWFKRSGSQLANFKLADLIDVVVGYSDKANRLSITKQINFDQLIKGEFYTHIADLLRIFIENILKHAHSNATQLPVKICVNVEKDVLHLVISNQITDFEKVQQLRDTTDNKKIDLGRLLSENKSGYPKANKILTSDLKNELNTFGTRVHEDENWFEVHSLIYFKDLLA